MHCKNVSRSLSPYSVFADGSLVARAPDIQGLFDVLKTLSDGLREQRRVVVYQEGLVATELPPSRVHVEVFDARGVLRPELASFWSLGRYFNVPSDKLHRARDHGWDADHRPRGMPIPGTGRSSGYNLLRSPSTQSERRQDFFYSEDGEPSPSIRPRRRAHHIPTAWDDDIRSDYGNRSWKRHRKTQWKPKPFRRQKG